MEKLQNANPSTQLQVPRKLFPGYERRAWYGPSFHKSTFKFLD
jgi:hypothetical protein